MRTRILLEQPPNVWGIESPTLHITKGDNIVFGQGGKILNLKVVVKVANLFKGTYDIHCSIITKTGTLEEFGFKCLTA